MLILIYKCERTYILLCYTYVDSIISQMSNGKPVSCPGWTRRVLATVAFAVAATILMHCGWIVTASEP